MGNTDQEPRGHMRGAGAPSVGDDGPRLDRCWKTHSPFRDRDTDPEHRLWPAGGRCPVSPRWDTGGKPQRRLWGLDCPWPHTRLGAAEGKAWHRCGGSGRPSRPGAGPTPACSSLASGQASSGHPGPLLSEVASPLLRVHFLDSNFPGRDDTQRKKCKNDLGVTSTPDFPAFL